MLEKLFDMKPIGWNSLSSCCCDRTAPMVKLDALHSRWKGLDLDGEVSMGAEVMALFSTSKACCLAAPHDQSFDSQGRMSFIMVWKVAGELHSLKNMTSGSKSPQFMEKAAFHSSPSLRQTLLKPQQRSRVVNHSVLCNLVSMLETNGSR